LVAAGPRKAAVPSGRVAAAEEHLEARAFLAAEQRASRLIHAINRSFCCFYDRLTSGPGNTPFRRFAPGCQQKATVETRLRPADRAGASRLRLGRQARYADAT
jgi:hypothetical protein